MKKILNKPENYVDETLEGIAIAYENQIGFYNGDKRVIISKYPVKHGKVGVVTGGGFGHIPLFLGYVGTGMTDACAVGNVFASPSYTKMEAAIRAADFGSGVLCLYGNYGGDRMNFEQAVEDAELDGIDCRQVRVTDDIASSTKETIEKRRGVAGIVYAYKIAGAAANKMMSLDEVTNITEKAVRNIRTLGFAISPCIVPEVGKPTFSISDDEIEVGMGIHGERGVHIHKMMTADEIAETAVNEIGEELSFHEGSEVSIMINGLGATPLEELFIVYRKVERLLKLKGIKIIMPLIGEYATSMEMAGLSVTIFKLDEELKMLLQEPAKTPFVIFGE